jgi:Uma2 family endonuclease
MHAARGMIDDVDPIWLDRNIQIRPLKRFEYERMVECGIFAENDRVELLRGVLVAKEPQGPYHAGTAEVLHDRLHTLLAGRARVRAHSPIAPALPDDSEPEPDIAVVPLGGSVFEHPTTALLVIEISNTSLRVDRGVKASLYAEAGIPEYWIVSLPEGLVEVRDEPDSGEYRRLRTLRRGESIAPSAFPDAVIAVSEILPPEPPRA